MIEIFTQLEGMIITSIDTGCGRKVLLSCFNDAHPSFSKSKLIYSQKEVEEALDKLIKLDFVREIDGHLTLSNKDIFKV
jgi:uncharacterized protein YlbG (UPF0298 family)